MPYKSYTVYDDPDFFKQYNQKRKRGDSPNKAIEQPIIDALIGPIAGKKVLDLGCGDGKYGIELLNRGAANYYGIEGSYKMAGLAKENLVNYPATVAQNDIEKATFGQSTYDLVISRLVLHYIADGKALFEQIENSLKQEGEFVFSIEHPIITSCYEAYHQEVRRGNWIVDNYFDSGERVNQWLGKKVVKYHRTLEEYWQALKAANLDILEIRESKPQRANFESSEEYRRRMRIPLFLFFKTRKK
ncbi:MAG: class I SAM-dependent methyltransferase [Bacteroidota bacterium]